MKKLPTLHSAYRCELCRYGVSNKVRYDAECALAGILNKNLMCCRKYGWVTSAGLICESYVDRVATRMYVEDETAERIWAEMKRNSTT